MKLRISLSKTERVRELSDNEDSIAQLKTGNCLQQYRQVVGMHSVYLVVKDFRGCLRGKFWCSHMPEVVGAQCKVGD